MFPPWSVPDREYASSGTSIENMSLPAPGSALSSSVTWKLTEPPLAVPVIVLVQPGLKLMIDVLCKVKSPAPWSM